MSYIILSEKKWNARLGDRLSKRINAGWYLIKSKEDFQQAKLAEIDPAMIFIPHWSYIIPQQIFQKYECIVFHMTDLPYGRGGSPLQNLIVRGVTETKISAIRVVKELDAGPVYLKRPLCLHGSAEEIFLRADSIMEEMIVDIITKGIKPSEQIGDVVKFARRTPDESSIENLDSIKSVYDYIRMLDADGYPSAYLDHNGFKYEFTRAQLKADNSVEAHVRILKK